MAEYVEVEIAKDQTGCNPGNVTVTFDTCPDGQGLLSMVSVMAHVTISREFLKERDGKFYVLAEPGKGSCEMDFP